MEDIGEHYFEELISRTVAQVSKRSSTGTSVKTSNARFDVRRVAREVSFHPVDQLREGSMNQRCLNMVDVLFFKVFFIQKII